MTATRGAGGTVHHVALLWPVPQVMAAIAMSRFFEWTPRLAQALIVLCVSVNLLQLNQYLYEFARNGSPGSWSDATSTLVRTLERSPAPVAAADWGLSGPVSVLSNGEKRVLDELLFRTGPEARDTFLEINDEQPDWVAWVPEYEVFQGVNDRTDEMARELGFLKEPVQTIRDRNGRPTIEVFRYVGAH